MDDDWLKYGSTRNSGVLRCGEELGQFVGHSFPHGSAVGVVLELDFLVQVYFGGLSNFFDNFVLVEIHGLFLVLFLCCFLVENRLLDVLSDHNLRRLLILNVVALLVIGHLFLLVFVVGVVQDYHVALVSRFVLSLRVLHFFSWFPSTIVIVKVLLRRARL